MLVFWGEYTFGILIHVCFFVENSAGKELQGMLDGHLPANWDRFLEDFPVDVKGLATRKSNSICLNQVAEGQWGRWGEAPTVSTWT